MLAFAYKEIEENREITLEDENDLTFLGLIAMMDPPREESKAAVAECIQAGIKPIMITGDHKITAAAIAKRIGILKDESEACEGAVIENMSDEELQEFVPKISVYARVSPEHKIRIVRAWQERGNTAGICTEDFRLCPCFTGTQDPDCPGMAGKRKYRSHDRRRCQRRSGSETGEYWCCDGNYRNGSFQRCGRYGLDRR